MKTKNIMQKNNDKLKKLYMHRDKIIKFIDKANAQQEELGPDEVNILNIELSSIDWLIQVRKSIEAYLETNKSLELWAHYRLYHDIYDKEDGLNDDEVFIKLHSNFDEEEFALLEKNYNAINNRENECEHTLIKK